MKRIKAIAKHVAPEADAIAGPAKAEHVHPDGWGYRDTSFSIDEKGMFSMSGSRYLYSGKRFPHFYEFIRKYGVDKDVHTPGRLCECPPPLRNRIFEEALERSGISCSYDDKERLLASHGHTVQEVYALRFGSLKRLVDAVAYPINHSEVERIVSLACQHNIALIPFGGGTTVSHSLLCDPNEKRMILSVNVSRMNNILNIDKDNMTATVQTGCVGSHLEKALNAFELTLGHEPDSWEFSTVGGWVATRASGMKKNVYGNIEDIVIDVKIVTPQGTLTRNTVGIPRVSSGPDVLQMILGSEGTLGVITEAVLKVRCKPSIKEYGSLVFPSFQHGLEFMRQVARMCMQPASIRLMDNLQFQLGSSLKPEQNVFMNFMDRLVKFYVLNVKRFVAENICAVTMTFEGNSKDEVLKHLAALNELASKHQGIPAGASNGIRGYFLTFVIAYLRDFGLRHQFIAESFETSVPWDKVATVISETKKQVLLDCKEAGIAHEPMISARVTQTYDSGACIYFYLGMSWKGIKDPVETYSRIEDRARACVMKNGGSISHHHGVGKIRKPFLESQIGSVGIMMLKGLKTTLDPKNIFASNNLI
jgi:alkyldihydroxyacetonephosphate synthase